MTTDYRALCAELLAALESWSPSGGGPLEGAEEEQEAALISRARTTLAEPEAVGASLEPRGCPTPGACSCPTAPIVSPDLLRALELAEAALADIGDGDREPGDDLAWAESRAAQDLPRIRRVLNVWRDHVTLAQPEAVGPTDEQLKVAYWEAFVEAAPCGADESWLAGLRAVARLGRPTPQPIPPSERLPEAVGPTPSDVAELFYRHMGEGSEVGFENAIAEALTRWGRPTITPIPVSERLPEAGKKVIVHYVNSLGNSRTVCAEWVPARSRTDDCLMEADDGFAKYDEENDKFYWPEGWYESIENWDEYGAVFINDAVTHWQPLPSGPAHALPLPTPEP